MANSHPHPDVKKVQPISILDLASKHQTERLTKFEKPLFGWLMADSKPKKDY